MCPTANSKPVMSTKDRKSMFWLLHPPWLCLFPACGSMHVSVNLINNHTNVLCVVQRLSQNDWLLGCIGAYHKHLHVLRKTKEHIFSGVPQNESGNPSYSICCSRVEEIAPFFFFLSNIFVEFTVCYMDKLISTFVRCFIQDFCCSS